MKDFELQLEYIEVGKLQPYERNNKKHTDEDVSEIAKSIEKYGFNDPIGLYGKNIIVEGHGRLEAAKKLGLEKVPCVRLDHMTDKERREYAILHNKTAELAEYDFDNLKLELEDLDLSDFDFSFLDDKKKDNPYTSKIKIPQYEIHGEAPSLFELIDEDKTIDLETEIKVSRVTEAEKEFLLKAAQRHRVFNYRNIAEYYAQASPEMQDLMEKSALVIIDYEDAIANGYVRLSERLKRLRDDNA